MTQLSDDCFAFGGDLLTVASALAQIQARVAPVVETETVPLQVAAGRILARRFDRRPRHPYAGYRKGGGRPPARSAHAARRGDPHFYRCADA